MNRDDQSDDDLTVIKYIGPARQQWLRDELKVRTYSDLAALSAEEIEKRLKATAKLEARSRIEGWIEEASTLAARATEGKSPASANTTGEHGTRRTSNSPKNSEGWESVGIFVVNIRQRTVDGDSEYLTEVSIHENGEQARSKEWMGIESELSFQWMLEQAGVEPTPEVPQQEDGEQAETPPVAEPEGEAEVNITEIQFFQPPDATQPLARGTSGEPIEQELRADKPFTLAVLFSLGGEAAQAIANNRPKYRLGIVANELETKVGTHLGDTDQESIVEGTLDYGVRAPQATLSAGVYRIWAMVTVQAANTEPDFIEVPSITVV